MNVKKTFKTNFDQKTTLGIFFAVWCSHPYSLKWKKENKIKQKLRQLRELNWKF